MAPIFRDLPLGMAPVFRGPFPCFSLVWPLFFVTFPLVWPLFFVDLFLPFPWYGPYFCVINLSFDAFFHFQKSLLLVNFRSNQKYEASTTIDEEAVESNNIC